MKMKRLSSKAVKTAVVVAVLATTVYAFSSGPPAGHTGAPGESTCADCHIGTLNSGNGSITIEGIPEVYEPGEEVVVTVRVTHPSRQRWGFQLTALDSSRRPAGTFTILNAARTRIINGIGDLSARRYVEHTTNGTLQGAQRGEWDVMWTAPDEDVGLITFYAAGNAANGDNTSSGDSIYTTSVTSGTATPAIVAPKYKKGKILMQVNGSNILDGAMLVVTSDALEEPELFTLRQNKKGTKWLVKKKELSMPGELRVDDVLPPGGTITMVVRNPDGTESAAMELSR